MPRETLAALQTEQIWDVLGIRLNGPKAEGKNIVLNWQFTDTNQSYVLTLENCALTYLSGAASADADAAFVLTRDILDAVIAKQTTFADAIAAGSIQMTGCAETCRAHIQITSFRGVRAGRTDPQSDAWRVSGFQPQHWPLEKSGVSNRLTNLLLERC